MRYYRLYFIDAFGHIEDVRECMAADDRRAIAEATLLDRGMTIEIWCQGEKVGEVEPVERRRQA